PRYPPIRLEVWSEHPFAQRISELNRNGRPAGTHDHARKRIGVCGRSEQRGGGANVWRDDVRLLEPKRVRDANHELAHRAWRHQRVSPLGAAESWEVDRDQVCRFGQPRPDWFVGEHTLRPWTEQ